MKSKGKVIVPIVLAAAVLVITGVVIYQHPLPGMEGWFPAPEEEPVVASQPVNEQPAVGSQVDSNAQESQESSEEESSAAPASSLTIEDTYRIDPAKTYHFEQPLQIVDIETMLEITVHSASLSKDLQGVDKSHFLYPPPDDLSPERTVVTDEEGNLLGSYSYLFVNLKVKNVVNTTAESCIGNINVIPVNKNDNMLDFESDTSTSSTCYISANEDKTGMDDYNYLTLKPYEEKEIVLGYLIYEPVLSKNARLFLRLNVRGEGHGEGGNIFFHPVVDLKLP